MPHNVLEEEHKPQDAKDDLEINRPDHVFELKGGQPPELFDEFARGKQKTDARDIYLFRGIRLLLLRLYYLVFLFAKSGSYTGDDIGFPDLNFLGYDFFCSPLRLLVNFYG